MWARKSNWHQAGMALSTLSPYCTCHLLSRANVRPAGCSSRCVAIPAPPAPTLGLAGGCAPAPGVPAGPSCELEGACLAAPPCCCAAAALAAASLAAAALACLSFSSRSSLSALSACALSTTVWRAMAAAALAFSLPMSSCSRPITSANTVSYWRAAAPQLKSRPMQRCCSARHSFGSSLYRCTAASTESVNASMVAGANVHPVPRSSEPGGANTLKSSMVSRSPPVE
mmetsp:Transcript_33569/g.85023  ORF Transcript_33569/g.85023 Transcript_33569/m.85023 type:complete len:228 (-) Transcript_33569:2411-3094(-)